MLREEIIDEIALARFEELLQEERERVKQLIDTEIDCIKSGNTLTPSEKDIALKVTKNILLRLEKSVDNPSANAQDKGWEERFETLYKKNRWLSWQDEKNDIKLFIRGELARQKKELLTKTLEI